MIVAGWLLRDPVSVASSAAVSAAGPLVACYVEGLWGVVPQSLWQHLAAAYMAVIKAWSGSGSSEELCLAGLYLQDLLAAPHCLLLRDSQTCVSVHADRCGGLGFLGVEALDLHHLVVSLEMMTLLQEDLKSTASYLSLPTHCHQAAKITTMQ